MKKPTIGRIVVYNTTEEERESLGIYGVPSKQLPAIIVQVHNSTLLNLKVITDGPGGDIYKTSSNFGNTGGTWFWPTIEQDGAKVPAQENTANASADPGPKDSTQDSE